MHGAPGRWIWNPLDCMPANGSQGGMNGAKLGLNGDLEHQLFSQEEP